MLLLLGRSAPLYLLGRLRDSLASSFISSIFPFTVTLSHTLPLNLLSSTTSIVIDITHWPPFPDRRPSQRRPLI
ncbi:uncharacterized protein G2W53_026743 [Senna tora]|uniref:Uncharacterized protein n=1 Tax=Senna tora TaxID=362788 RepID=A0A834TFS2_9FABA|nr:uncharacterized protein G2W53_026743 [Senna tora]